MMQLTPEQQNAADEAVSGKHQILFITGKAGTGKSTILRDIIPKLGACAIVAPTGVAAMNVGGATIHSLFRVPLGPIETKDLVVGGRQREIMLNLETLIIDEISMVRSDLLNAIDYILKKARDSKVAFGGVQVIMFGDLAQLPPVVQKGDDYRFLQEYFGGEFFFDAPVIRENPFKIIALNNVLRQKDPAFVDALNLVRNGDPSSLPVFNEHVYGIKKGLCDILLTTTRAAAQAFNRERLGKLDTPEFVYEATIEGNFGEDFPADKTLKLKVGARVMITKNNFSAGYVNGTIGRVEALYENRVIVKLKNGEFLTITKEIWEKEVYSFVDGRLTKEVIGEFIQFPLKLAWAVTIHKSQGLTFDRPFIDVGSGAFCHGQVYTALSRGTSLEGMFLKRPIYKRDLITDPQVKEFHFKHGIK
jgi:ATP-dependent exoDNAse (exonuclease V) alpha subunit